MAKRSLRITSRFALVVLVLVPSLGALAWVGVHGMQSGRDAANSLYSDHLLTIRNAGSLEIDLQSANQDALELITTSDLAQRASVTDDLASRLAGSVAADIASVEADSANDPLERPRAANIVTDWAMFQELVATAALQNTTTANARQAANQQLTAIFGPATESANSIIATESQEADAAHAGALAEYRSSLRWMAITIALALLAVTAVVGWLIRSVLPRTLEYSKFAVDVTHGNYSKRLRPSGTDELADLGRTLDDLAQRRQEEDLHDHRQFEFTDTLQAAETEQEAHDLVKRHLERSIRDSTVTVLNRNNSADRLQAVTAVAPGSALAAGLDAAKPRSCLAVRMARPHYGVQGVETLLSCPVCATCPGQTTCTPLLVGGEVIGSILADHPHPLGDQEQRAVREVVSQAAPVLGNLRNLAIAELRAATDALTGLPNKRAMEHAIKRMSAQSTRSNIPLAALMCDLDHFKSINDRFGHGRGDEVLAAVGAVFSECLRPVDFAARYGGEEFLILLPATDTDNALQIAERIRLAVAGIRIPTVDQPITVSIGVAVMPTHALDPDTLTRSADRALYTAKNGGRNRVELAVPRTDAPPSLSPEPVDPEFTGAPSVNGHSA